MTVEDIEELSMHEIHEMMTEKEKHNETHGKHKKPEKRSEEDSEEKSEDKEIESHHNHNKEKEGKNLIIKKNKYFICRKY